MSRLFNHKIGFTLAEVLITLGIIGVVAALTIPTLMNSNQNIQYVVGLKKAYSETNQVLKQMAADNNCTDDLKCTGIFATGTNNQTFGDEFIKYFKIAKNCRVALGQGCWNSSTNGSYNGKDNNPNYSIDTWDRYKFITTDGMSFAVDNYANSCGYNWSAPSPQGLGYLSQTCGFLFVDVNGLKGPNYFGRDIFSFFITNGRGALLYPQGGKDDGSGGANNWWNYNNRNACFSTTNQYGEACTGRVIEKSWVMDY